MGSALLSSITGGRGEFVSESSTASIVVPIGQTADIVITPTSGKRLRLIQLQAQTATLTTDMSVDVGAKTVLNTIRMGGGSSGSDNATGQANIGGNKPNQPPILGEIDEVITLSFATATLQVFVYSTEEGN